MNANQIQKIGIGLTSCGCLILWLPIAAVLLVFAFALLAAAFQAVI